MGELTHLTIILTHLEGPSREIFNFFKWEVKWRSGLNLRPPVIGNGEFNHLTIILTQPFIYKFWELKIYVESTRIGRLLISYLGTYERN